MEEKITEMIIKFRDDRGWKQYHNPKDLAISLSLEIAELLEIFQWSSSEEALIKKMPSIKEELADVFIYAVLFADSVGLNVSELVMEKLKINNEKYPIEKAFGKKEKYTEL